MSHQHVPQVVTVSGWLSVRPDVSLMVCLGCVDVLYLSSAVLVFSIPLLWPSVSTTWTFTRLITVLLPVAHIALNGSILLTMCLALERYITVCFPFFRLRHRWSSVLSPGDHV